MEVWDAAAWTGDTLVPGEEPHRECELYSISTFTGFQIRGRVLECEQEQAVVHVCRDASKALHRVVARGLLGWRGWVKVPSHSTEHPKTG